MVASSLGVDDALLQKLVEVVDVWHTKKGLKPKRKCQNEPRKKKTFLQKLALAVVPLNPAVVPLQSNLLEFDSILGKFGVQNFLESVGNWQN